MESNRKIRVLDNVCVRIRQINQAEVDYYKLAPNNNKFFLSFSPSNDESCSHSYISDLNLPITVKILQCEIPSKTCFSWTATQNKLSMREWYYICILTNLTCKIYVCSYLNTVHYKTMVNTIISSKNDCSFLKRKLHKSLNITHESKTHFTRL